MKDDNYYTQRGNDRRHRNHWPCRCPHAHPFELAEVIRNQHLNPRKACAEWQKGKQVCSECRFLVNMENHHLRCSTTVPRNPLADVTPPQEDQEATPAGYTPDPPTEPIAVATMTAALQDEQLTLLGEIVTVIHKTTNPGCLPQSRRTPDARPADERVPQRGQTATPADEQSPGSHHHLTTANERTTPSPAAG